MILYRECAADRRERFVDGDRSALVLVGPARKKEKKSLAKKLKKTQTKWPARVS